MCALEHFERAVRDDPVPRVLLSAEESLKMIFGANAIPASYIIDQTCVAPLRPDSEVSWPAQAGSASRVECLPTEEAELVSSRAGRLLKPAEEWKEVFATVVKARVFWDTALRDGRCDYVAFVAELIRCRMCVLRFERPLENVGVRFVLKNRPHLGSLSMLEG